MNEPQKRRNQHFARTQPIETDGKELSARQLARELRRIQNKLQVANRRNEILEKALAILS